MNKFKKLGAILLVIALLITSVPLYAFADISNSKSAKWQEGRKLVSSDGDYYTFKYQGFMQIWQYDTRGGEKYKGWTREFKDPRRIFSLTQGSDSVRGYCLEHGIIAEGGVKYSAETLSANKVFNSLSEGQKTNITLALLYGYGTSGSLKSLGFYSSSYDKSGHEYNSDDWYMATQIIVWEIEQGFRKNNLDRADSVSLHYGTGTSYSNVKASNNVSIYHYYRVLKGTPAEDIYKWMLSSMKNHKSIPSRLSGSSSEPAVVKLKQKVDSNGNPTNKWVGTVSSSDGKRLFISSGTNKSKLDITYDENSNKYVLTWTGKNAADGPDSSVRYTIREYVAGRTTPDEIRNNMRVWVHKLSDTLHRQYILAGYFDQFKWYIKVKAVNAEVKPTEPDEPEYLPEVEIPISKIDANPGWDGDNTTPMGDAGLDAEYVLTDEKGNEVDRIKLDENGKTAKIRFAPFKLSELKASKTGVKEHKDGSHSCEVKPVKITWSASKAFKLKEIAPEGRCIGPDTGERIFTINYEAVTENSQSCSLNPSSWSDIKYTVSCGDRKIHGTEDDIASTLVLDKKEFTFENDCLKGSMELEKLLEDKGGETVSTESLWKIYLKGSSRDGRYIRFVEEESYMDGTRIYRCTGDDKGTSCQTESLKIGSNGKLKVFDIPYGEYYVEEVKADSADYITECFELDVKEGSQTYNYKVVDKKAKAKVTLLKFDEESGKQVRLPGTKVRIKNKATGEYILKKGELDDNGELELPFMLENGRYVIEEYELPIGYYAKDGKCSIYEFEVKESGKHMEGQPYEYGEVTVKLNNSREKGRIHIEKTDENGKGIKGVIFGIFAAADNWIHDGPGSLVMKKSEDGNIVDIKKIKSSNADNRLEEIKDILGNTYSSDVYDMGIFDAENGARCWYMTERRTSNDNRDMLVYTTPEDKDTTYSYSFEKDGIRYDVDAVLKNEGSRISSDIKMVREDLSGRKLDAADSLINVNGEDINDKSFDKDGISFDMEKSMQDKDKRCVDKDADYEIPEGFELYDDESSYVIITDGSEYMVLLDDMSWRYCKEDGSSQDGSMEECDIDLKINRMTSSSFHFTLDGFEVEYLNGMITFTGQSSEIKPVISNGSGFAAEGSSFTAVDEYIPYYFTSPDNEIISLGYSGGKIHVMIEADKKNKHLPSVDISKEKEGELDSMTLNLYSGEDIDLVERFPGSRAVCSSVENKYCIDIVTPDEVQVKLGNGYVLKLYCSRSEDGNGIGVMEAAGTYSTNGAVMGQLVDVITTDENGKADSRLLDLGKYIIRELKGDAGHVASPYGFETELLPGGSDVSIVTNDMKIVNERVNAELELSKTFETEGGTGKYEAAAGAVFGIFTKDGKLVEEAGTDKAGHALIRSKLPKGIYYVQETSTKKEYGLDPMKYYFEIKEQMPENDNTFEFEEEGISGEVFQDGYGTAKLVINILHNINMPEIKVDGKVQKPSEAKADRDIYVLNCKDKMEVEAGNHQIILNEKGDSFDWTLDGISKSAENEVLSDMTSIYFEADVDKGDVITINGKDKICVGKGVKKISRHFKSGNELEVLLNGKNITEKVRTSRCVTFERQSGMASNIMIKINADGSMKPVAIKNDIVPGTLELTKEDMETGETLPGAEFEILDDSNGKPGDVIYTGKTGSDGKMEVEEYKGSYWYHETKAPSGYICDGEYYQVHVENNDITRVTMVNEKKEKKEKHTIFYKTGRDFTVEYAVVISFVLLAFALVLRRRMR